MAQIRTESPSTIMYVVTSDDYEDMYGVEFYLYGVYDDYLEAKKNAPRNASIHRVELNKPCEEYIGGYRE